MAKKPPSKATIKPPTRKELSDAAKLLPKGHSAAGRVLAEKSKAIRDGAPSPKPTKRK
jgi:hypothetical protein